MSDAHTLGQNILSQNIPNITVRRAKDIVFQQFDDELLAVDAQSGICYSLNESAGRIWGLIEKPASLASICAQLCAEYDVDEETCRREVSAVLQQLSQAELVSLGK